MKADVDAEPTGTVELEDEWVHESRTERPHVTHDDHHEITMRSVILSAVLSIVLGMANVYLGLLVGLTVSASIPAAVMSMAVLSCLPNSNILENNIVQTGASAGESLAAGVIFTLPGLVIIKSRQNSLEFDENKPYEGVDGWESFLGGEGYLYGTALALLGGILGIAWSIPLRKALIVDIKPPLKFPEGVATAQVLKSGEAGGSAVKSIAMGGGIGCALAVLKDMGAWAGSLSLGFVVGPETSAIPLSWTLNVKSALYAVGFIVGPKIASVLFLGAMIHYTIVIPIYASVVLGGFDVTGFGDNGIDQAAAAAGTAFGTTRYIGVGLMIVGGIWSLVSIRRELVTAISVGIKSMRKASSENTVEVARYDRDLSFKYIMVTVLLTMVPLYIIFSAYSGQWGFCIIMSLVIAVISFLFSAVAAYMAGLVGSSNNPVSGVTICSALAISGLVLLMWGTDDPRGPPTVVMMCTAVACACAISGDNMQDLKSGFILGATPWRQELIMIVGVSAASFVVLPVLEVLNIAYGIGVFGGARETALQAPQATVISSIPVGIIRGGLPFAYIGIGCAFGVVIIILDEMLARSKINYRLPILAFAVSFYLPISYMIPIFIGSLMTFLQPKGSDPMASEGILYSAGLVAGDAITGVLLAIPIAIASGVGTDRSLGSFYKVFKAPTWATVFPLLILLGTLGYVARFEPFTKNKKISTES